MQQGLVVCSDAIMQEFAPISEVELCGRSDTRCVLNEFITPRNLGPFTMGRVLAASL
jgi:hypothetical protein